MALQFKCNLKCIVSEEFLEKKETAAINLQETTSYTQNQSQKTFKPGNICQIQMIAVSKAGGW